MAIKRGSDGPSKTLNRQIAGGDGVGGREESEDSQEGISREMLRQRRISKLTPDVVEAFTLRYLHARYDDPKPIPPFHRRAWALYCTPYSRCAIAAPRGHAKSSSLTFAWTLANLCFRAESYVILLGSSEELAIEQLGDMTLELSENEELIRDFQIAKFVVMAKTEIIVEFLDGEQFRVLARGAQQKIRGRKWRGRRPGLIVADDLEDDEQVEKAERRQAFKKWFFRAVIPALSRTGRIRYHGTIIANKDTLLARILRNKTWNTLFFKAHRGFNDFRDILWPEQFSEETLRSIRDGYVAEGDAAGYSNEYLNSPINEGTRFLRPDWFLPMQPEDHGKDKKYILGVDLAISKADTANRTAMVVNGKDKENKLYFVDVDKGRWDTEEIFEKLFEMAEKWDIEAFVIEDGHILKAMLPLLRKELMKRNLAIPVLPISNLKDKKVKGRSYQKKLRAGLCSFDKESSWYDEFEGENLDFTGVGDSVLDDQFDAAAICARAWDVLPELEELDFLDGDDYDEYLLEIKMRNKKVALEGRSKVTGY